MDVILKKRRMFSSILHALIRIKSDYHKIVEARCSSDVYFFMDFDDIKSSSFFMLNKCSKHFVVLRYLRSETYHNSGLNFRFEWVSELILCERNETKKSTVGMNDVRRVDTVVAPISYRFHFFREHNKHALAAALIGYYYCRDYEAVWSSRKHKSWLT